MKKIACSIDDIYTGFEPFAACIGYFDGLHLGHLELINKTIQTAADRKILSAVITFDPDPWVVLKNIPNPQHLTTMQDRILLAEEMGIDYWIAIHFDRQLADLSSFEFVTKILLKMPLKALICGFDFNYGKMGKGNIASMINESAGAFDVIEIPEVTYEDSKISSTRIFECLKNGDVELAAKLLARPYQLKGVVVGGKQIGRKIGFPTANLQLDQEYAIPRIGVYAGKVSVDGSWYKAMISIGKNPTVSEDNELTIEANILDFDQILYGKTVQFSFCSYIRDEMKFSRFEDLIDQIRQDEKSVRSYFRHLD